MDMTRRDYEMILEALVNEQRSLRDADSYLRRMSLSDGNQIIKIENRMREIEETAQKVEKILLSM